MPGIGSAKGMVRWIIFFNFREKMKPVSAINCPGGPGIPGITLENISLEYDGSPLFDAFSLEIAGGMCTCLLGPSGCGKSTLLKMISGNSSISYQGNIYFDQAASHVNMTAWMSQNDLLLPWMSVENNVLLGARLRSEVTPVLREKASSLLDAAGLGEYKKALPGILSGGMRQRVALLRTLMEERPVLLMDEPFSALDALTRIKLQNMAAKMTRGKTVLLVTHDPLEALRLADRIVVLSGKPAGPAFEFEPGGDVPRDIDDDIIGRQYPLLFKKLMEASS